MFSRRAIAPLALLLLAGCQTSPLPQAGSLDPGFGEALKYDMAIQTIDPDPVYDQNDAQPGASGVKGAAAVRRYRTDAVKELEVQATTTSGAGSAGPR